MAAHHGFEVERDGRLYKYDVYHDVFVCCDRCPSKQVTLIPRFLSENTDLPGVKWYCDGYDVDAFSLVDAEHATRCNVSFRKVMLQFSTKVVRGYWHRLGLMGKQRDCPTLTEVPLGVKLALSFVLQCDVTRCSPVDIHHYLVDLFSVTSENMLKRPRYLVPVDESFWLTDAAVNSPVLAKSPVVKKADKSSSS